MFNYKKRLYLSPLIMVGVFSSFAQATVPNAPGPYIGVTKIDDTSVRINFNDNSDNETGFILFGDGIYKSLSANDETINPNVYTDITGLICNKVYQVEAIAYNNDGNSTLSDKGIFRMSSTFGVDCPEVPNAPGPYIGVTKIDDTSVRVNFLDNSDNETGFRVIGNDINVSIPANDETLYSHVYQNITGLTCDKVYSIQALAFNTHGNSDLSELRAFNINTTFSTNCDDNDTIIIPLALDPTSIPATIFD